MRSRYTPTPEMLKDKQFITFADRLAELRDALAVKDMPKDNNGEYL